MGAFAENFGELQARHADILQTIQPMLQAAGRNSQPSRVGNLPVDQRQRLAGMADSTGSWLARYSVSLNDRNKGSLDMEDRYLIGRLDSYRANESNWNQLALAAGRSLESEGQPKGIGYPAVNNNTAGAASVGPGTVRAGGGPGLLVMGAAGVAILALIVWSLG